MRIFFIFLFLIIFPIIPIQAQKIGIGINTTIVNLSSTEPLYNSQITSISYQEDNLRLFLYGAAIRYKIKKDIPISLGLKIKYGERRNILKLESQFISINTDFSIWELQPSIFYNIQLLNPISISLGFSTIINRYNFTEITYEFIYANGIQKDLKNKTDNNYYKFGITPIAELSLRILKRITFNLGSYYKFHKINYETLRSILDLNPNQPLEKAKLYAQSELDHFYFYGDILFSL